MHRYVKKGLSFLVPVFSLCLASSAFASGYAKPYFDGFYAGLGGGIVSSMAKNTTGFSISPPPYTVGDVNLQSIDFDSGKHGVNGNAFVGYGQTLDSHYYLGGELFGNVSSPKIESSVTLYQTMFSVKNPYSFGGNIRGGYIIFPKVMLYLLFGLDYAKFKIDHHVMYGLIRVENNFNRWRLGYTPGIGAQIGLCDYLSLRLQYDYTFYSSFSHSSSTMYLTTPYVLDTKVKPSRGLFSLKLSLKF